MEGQDNSVITPLDLFLIAALLSVIILLLGVIIWQQNRQHRQLIQWIDSLAEMVGEAIDKINQDKKGQQQ